MFLITLLAIFVPLLCSVRMFLVLIYKFKSLQDQRYRFLYFFKQADFTATTAADVQRFDDECGTANSVPADRLALFKKGEFTDDQLSKCHIHCVAKKMNIFEDTQGPIQANTIDQIASNNDKPRENIKTEVEKCAATELKRDDVCEWAFVVFVCLQEAGFKVSPDIV